MDVEVERHQRWPVTARRPSFDIAAGFAAGSLVPDIKTPGTTSILVWLEEKKNFPQDLPGFARARPYASPGK